MNNWHLSRGLHKKEIRTVADKGWEAQEVSEYSQFVLICFFFFLMRICLNTEIKDPVDRGTERESSIPKRSKRDNELQ